MCDHFSLAIPNDDRWKIYRYIILYNRYNNYVCFIVISSHAVSILLDDSRKEEFINYDSVRVVSTKYSKQFNNKVIYSLVRDSGR